MSMSTTNNSRTIAKAKQRHSNEIHSMCTEHKCVWLNKLNSIQYLWYFAILFFVMELAIFVSTVKILLLFCYFCFIHSFQWLQLFSVDCILYVTILCVAKCGHLAKWLVFLRFLHNKDTPSEKHEQMHRTTSPPKHTKNWNKKEKRQNKLFE